ncbi:hypothetical protein JCM6882_000536 [Rhodosporidiobolus microsporus]
MSSTNTDAATTGRHLLAIPKLTGKGSYQRWAIAITLYLKKSRPWDVVNGRKARPVSASTVPTAAEAKVIEDWEVLDDTAKFDLMSTVDAEQQDKLFRLGADATSKQYWDLLERENKATGDMRNLALQLAAIGEPVSDLSFLVLVKASLPASWDTITFILDGLGDLDKDTVCQRIIAEAERRALRSKDKSTSSRGSNAAALVANHSGTSSSPSGKKGVKCYNCGKTGHISRECRSSPTAATLAARNKSSSSSSSPTKANKSSTTLVSDESKGNFVFCLSTQAVPNLHVRPQPDAPLEDERWIMDSGAGCHFTGRLDALSDYIEDASSIEVADNRVIVSPGYGSATLMNSNGDKVKLAKVLYLPGGSGLLSISALSAKGVKVEFSASNGVGIAKLGDKVIFDTIPGSAYVINAKLVKPVVVPADTTAFSSREKEGASLMTWHRRYGHIAPSTIVTLANEGVVNGLVLTDKHVHDCELCILAKSKRSPFSATSTPASDVLQRVFIDLGFVDKPDFEGRTIYLAIIDQFSTARWTFPLTSKSAKDVMAVFHEWRVGIENITGKTLSRVRSDNGSEFVNSTFEAYFKAAGILHETTAAYTPEQNSQVERLNRSLMSLVKAMLHDANLPKEFWSFALAIATYKVYGRTPLSGIYSSY